MKIPGEHTTFHTVKTRNGGRTDGVALLLLFSFSFLGWVLTFFFFERRRGMGSGVYSPLG